MYADYVFYTSTYCGKIPSVEVIGCLTRASYMLDKLTFGRLHDDNALVGDGLAQCVKMANCALADAEYIHGAELTAGGKITSETVGTWSRTLQADNASWERQCYTIAAQYIPIGSGLLCRGVG